MSGFAYEGAVPEGPLISVESTNEWQIHDILPNGQERYLQPLTFSDHVAKLAHQIDWMKLVQQENGEINEEAVSEDRKPAQRTGIGPWEGVSKQLHSALTEMNVLLDLISIALSGKYLVFDPVSHDASDDSKSGGKADAYTLVSKRKSLCLASSVLLDFVERQKQKLGVQQSQNDEQSFFRELTNLRRRWRLKKSGDIIYGDLSYRSFGAKFRPNTTFEVRKKDLKNSDAQKTMGTAISTAMVTSGGTLPSLIDVVVPHHLTEECVLKIFIFDEENCSLPLDMLTTLDRSRFRSCFKSASKDVYPWQERLERAQKTLICKDMFAQLSKEAVHLNYSCCSVTGDAVMVKLDSSHLMCVFLTSKEKDTVPAKGVLCDEMPSPCLSVYVLEHSLSQMFSKQIDSLAEAVILQPVSTPLAYKLKQLRLAGPEAMNARQVCDLDDDKLLLEQLTVQAAHYLLLQRTKTALEELAGRCNDPTIAIDWNSEIGPCVALARIHMVTPFYEFCARAMFSLEVRVKTLHVTMKDAEAAEVMEDVDELIRLFEAQARQLIVSAAGKMSRPLKWHTVCCCLEVSDHRGVLAPTTIIAESSGAKAVCIRFPVDSPEPLLYIQTGRAEDSGFLTDGPMTSDKLCNIRGRFQQVDCRRLCGLNFLHQLELIMSLL